MTVYKEKHPGTGKVRYRIDVLWTYPDGRTKRVRKISPVNTMRGAEQYERDIRAALADGTWGTRKPDQVPTFTAFQERLFKAQVSGLKASTRNSYETIWREHVLPLLGSLRLNEVTVERIQKFKADLREKKHKPKTINNVLSQVHNALEVAAEWHVIKRDDVPTIEWVEVGKQKFDFLTFEEADRLHWSRYGDLPWGPMITFAMNTGLRQGELLALRWSNITFGGRKVTVDKSVWQGIEDVTKTRRVRHVPLNALARQALGRLPDGRGDALVFVGLDGQPLTKNGCRRPLYNASDIAQLGRRIGWHVLRHTFASHLVMNGKSLKAVQELMGHATLEMTMRYAHLAPGHLDGVVETLERPGAQVPPPRASEQPRRAPDADVAECPPIAHASAEE